MTLASSNSATGLQSDTGAPKGGGSGRNGWIWLIFGGILHILPNAHGVTVRDLLLEICRFCIVLVFRLILAFVVSSVTSRLVGCRAHLNMTLVNVSYIVEVVLLLILFLCPCRCLHPGFGAEHHGALRCVRPYLA